LHHVLDKALSVRDKYGPEFGWKLNLRYNEERVGGEPIEFREQVGGAQSGISCIVKDDRWRPVELIRKPDDGVMLNFFSKGQRNESISGAVGNMRYHSLNESRSSFIVQTGNDLG